MPSSGCSKTDDTFDVIVVDFPDPTNFSIGKLYTNAFYACWTAPGGQRLCRDPDHLAAGRAPEFLDGGATIESVGLRATPYHAHVPSFGEWGFVIASRRPWRAAAGAARRPALPHRDGLPRCSTFRATWRGCRPK
jgi:spermidine synthase